MGIVLRDAIYDDNENGDDGRGVFDLISQHSSLPHCNVFHQFRDNFTVALMGETKQNRTQKGKNNRRD